VLTQFQITGGNKTCYGTCERAELAWNNSVPLISASPNAPYLALLDCETDPVLVRSEYNDASCERR
jgi:hypothetical protein